MKQIVGGDKYDLVKGGLSIMIVVLHSHFLYKLICPLLHICVPLFFIMSSFFFFQRYDRAVNNQSFYLQKYVKRNLLLLFFWSCVFLPLSIHMSAFESNGFISYVVQFIKTIIFGEFFPASWFITASIFAVLTLVFISKLINSSFVWCICISSYFLCLLSSSYSSFQSICNEGIITLINIIGKPHNSFFVALLWINIGRWFANNLSRIKNLDVNYTSLYVAFFSLFAEYLLTQMYSSPLAADCYLSYIFICPAIFILIIKAPEVALNNAIKIREFSVCTFCTHGTIIYYVLNPMTKSIGFQGQLKSMCVLILTILICSLIYKLISAYKEKYHWLRYSL